MRTLTDGSGNVTGTAQYDAFGASRGQTGRQSSFGLAGQQTDPESGLVLAGSTSSAGAIRQAYS
jgi:hypothetical protein